MNKNKEKLITKLFGVCFILAGAKGLTAIIIYINMSIGMLERFSGRIGVFEAFFGGSPLGNIKLWLLNFLYTMLLIASIGIFRLSAWARRTTILLSSLIVLVYLIHIPLSTKAALRFNRDVIPTQDIMISCVIDIFIMSIFGYGIYFFTRPIVKEQFK